MIRTSNIVLIDATHIRVHPHGTDSRGGLTVKIAPPVNALSNRVRFLLLPRQQHDITSFDALTAGITCQAFIDDKAFDAHWLRESLAANGIEPVIPLRKGTAGHLPHACRDWEAVAKLQERLLGAAELIRCSSNGAFCASWTTSPSRLRA
jgi:hypothetical protein